MAIDTQTVRQIKTLCARGVPQRKVAAMFRISQASVSAVMFGDYDKKLYTPYLRNCTRRKLAKQVEQWDAPKVGSLDWKAAMVLFASFEIGQQPSNIAWLTGIPEGEVITMAYRLRENGVWGRDYRTMYLEYVPPCDPFAVQVEFTMNVLVATGKVVKSSATENGDGG